MFDRVLQRRLHGGDLLSHLIRAVHRKKTLNGNRRFAHQMSSPEIGRTTSIASRSPNRAKVPTSGVTSGSSHVRPLSATATVRNPAIRAMEAAVAGLVTP